jgi:MFS family permease
MKANKYIITLLAVYLVYLTHGIQAIILSQNLDQFVTQWGCDKAGIYSAIAYSGLGKFIFIWICGELSDRIGRKIMIALGAIMYIIFFAVLLTTHDYTLAVIAAFLSGAATSFFDGACYPALQESWVKAPGTAVILVKGVISASGLIYPLLVVSLRAAGSWQVGITIPLVMSILVLLVGIIAPYSYDAELKERKAAAKAGKLVGDTGKKQVLDLDAQRAAARFLVKPSKLIPVGCALYGFIAMAAMFSAQQLLTRYGKTVVGMNDLSSAALTSLYTGGSLAAVIIWGVFMSKFRWRPLKVLLVDTIGSVLAYALVCLVQSPTVVQIAAVGIGFFAAGGALQCGIALMQEFNPGNKGRNVGIYYSFMAAASYVLPVIQSWLTSSSNEGQAIVYSLLLNLTLTIVGCIFMFVLAVNYKKWFGVSFMSPRGDNE